MVVFLNGSLGVGKTTVGQYLLWNQPKTVFLEGDALCAINPFDAYDKQRIQTLIEIIHFMVVQYKRMGYESFVVDSIFEKESEIESMNDRLRETEPRVFHYLLFCEQAQRERHIVARKRGNYLWELERSAALHDLLQSTFWGSRTTKMIETTGMEANEVGEFLLEDLRKRGALPCPSS